MSWFRVDDKFHEHPKLAAAGPLAWVMWFVGLAYCNRNLTDGFIPFNVARSLVHWEFLEPTEDGRNKVMSIDVGCGMSGDKVDCDYVIGLLLDYGLWEDATGGYQVHDYTDWQSSKAEIESIREKKQAAGQAGGQASAQARAQAKGKQNPTKKEEVRKKKLENPPLPPEGDAEIPENLESCWKEWLAYRRERKLPAFKPITIKRQIAFLAAQPDPAACVEQSIRHGWQGLFELKTNGAVAVQDKASILAELERRDRERAKNIGN